MYQKINDVKVSGAIETHEPFDHNLTEHKINNINLKVSAIAPPHQTKTRQNYMKHEIKPKTNITPSCIMTCLIGYERTLVGR